MAQGTEMDEFTRHVVRCQIQDMESTSPIISREFGAEMDILRCVNRNVGKGDGYWVQRATYDFTYDRFNDRRYWFLGEVTSVTDSNFVVQYDDENGVRKTDSVEITEAQQNMTVERVLEVARENMRCFSWQDMEDEMALFNSKDIYDYDNNGEHRAHFERWCSKCRRLDEGEIVDFFISYSNWDLNDHMAHHHAVKAVSEEFFALHGRYPTFFLARASLLVADNPTKFWEYIGPCYGYCKNVLVLGGSTYFSRKNCVLDLWLTFMSTMNEEEFRRKLVVVPFYHPESGANTYTDIENFNIDELIIWNANSKVRLDNLFQVGGSKNKFMEAVRGLDARLISFLIQKGGGFTYRYNIFKDVGRLQSSKPHYDASVKTHVFLTHTWNYDTSNRNNHERVGLINEALKAKGIITWFDSDKMTGEIRRQMVDGIDNTKVVLVFITAAYRDKVNGDNPRDNCLFEFNYAVDQRTTDYMIPIVMEENMSVGKDWKRNLGGALGGHLYIPAWHDFTGDVLDKVADEIVEQVKLKLGGTLPWY